MDLDTTTGASSTFHTPADNCELIASALHPDDAEQVAAGAVECDLEVVAEDDPRNDLD